MQGDVKKLLKLLRARNPNKKYRVKGDELHELDNDTQTWLWICYLCNLDANERGEVICNGVVL